MSDEEEKNALRRQVFERMNFKETDELLAIWRKGDHEEWTDTALDVVKEILLSRLGEIPAEEENIEQQIENQSNVASRGEKKLAFISFLANLLSWIVLVLYTIIFVVRVILGIQDIAAGVPFNLQQIYGWLGILSSLVFSFIYFVVLQAISKFINLLLEKKEQTNHPVDFQQ